MSRTRKGTKKSRKEVTTRKKTLKKATSRKRTNRKQTEWGIDVQNWLGKTGTEFHWRAYQYMGSGTHLEKLLKRGDPGIKWLDKITKQRDIDHSKARNLQDKHKADAKMIASRKRVGQKVLLRR